jgi:hypothetical protein
VFCGLITDNKLVPDPDTVMGHFLEEFDNLLHLTLLIGPQDGHVGPDTYDEVHEWIRGDMDSVLGP